MTGRARARQKEQHVQGVGGELACGTRNSRVRCGWGSQEQSWVHFVARVH